MKKKEKEERKFFSGIKKHRRTSPEIQFKKLNEKQS